MPTFKYTSADESGKQYKGIMDAAGSADLQQKLKIDGQYLLKYGESKNSAGKPFKSSVLADFSRQIGSLVGAGISLVRALSIICEEEGLKPKQRKVYSEINKSLRHGTPFSQAMEEQGVFPPLMIHMYRSAEASGNLEQTAKKMAESYDKDTRLSSKVKSSMLYPKILSVIIVIVVAIIMGYVMPQFKELFSQMDSLPIATRILFAISNLVKNYWWLLIPGIIAIVVLLKVLFRLPKVKYYKDEAILHLPIVGKLMRVIYTARFARTLSSLYSCGISIVSALEITRSVIGNSYVEAQFDKLIAGVRSGRALSECLSEVNGFSKKLSDTVKVGEESGNLENLLVNIADSFDYESEMSLNKLVALVEPVMIAIMACIVGFIMIAVVMPIYNSYSAIR